MEFLFRLPRNFNAMPHDLYLIFSSKTSFRNIKYKIYERTKEVKVFYLNSGKGKNEMLRNVNFMLCVSVNLCVFWKHFIQKTSYTKDDLCRTYEWGRISFDFGDFYLYIFCILPSKSIVILFYRYMRIIVVNRVVTATYFKELPLIMTQHK